MTPDVATRTRGKLRVYLGAAPGVGKTYAALDEIRRRHSRGTDAVVGFVETHGRANTIAMLEGLEVVPRRTLEHRGSSFEEMDLDAILQRHPTVVLIDEMAHTNVPGSVHEKRWQDVEQILDAGIDVITTVNIQHLESVNDVVEKITGVKQQETVPDAVVRAADQIELRDVSAEALRRRLAHGNVYAPEKVDAALSNYFRAGNLNALREIALLWTADRVDAALQQYRDENDIDSTWETRERVVVALTGGKSGETLIRRAARIAARSGAGDLLAVHVVRSDGLRGSDPAQLASQRQLVESLGGTYHQVSGDDIPDALLTFARAENATQLVLGDSARSRFATFLGGAGVGATTIRESGDIDVHIVTHHEVRRALIWNFGIHSERRRIAGLIFALLAPVALTAALFPFSKQVNLTSDTLLFLLLTMVCSLAGGLLTALVASVESSLLLNYYFTPPIFTFDIQAPNNAFALVVFVLVSVLVSTTVDQVSRRAREAAHAAAEARTLADLASGAVRGPDRVTGMLERIRENFALDGVTLLARSPDGITWAPVSTAGVEVASLDAADGQLFAQDGLMIGLRGKVLRARDQRVLAAFAAQIAIAYEQARLRDEAAAAAPLKEANKVRTALLAAVGHDLRTPLAAAKASVSSLRSRDIDLSLEDRRELLGAADQSLDKLAALVENLLDMSRLQAGAMAITLATTDLGEVVARALDDLGAVGRKVLLEIPDELPAVIADAGLLERVVANLLANAVRFSPLGQPPLLTASAVADRVEIRVVDRGPGIPVADRDLVFLPFQRLGDTDNDTGVGLGLALSRGLTEAMGGSLEAAETPGGGLTMVITLAAREES